MSLVQELEEVIKGCNSAGVEYALCGGLSLAIPGLARATVNIDMLVQEHDVAAISQVAQSCGFNVPAMDMTFSQGAVEMMRFTKITGVGSVIPIDFLIVTPKL